MHRKIEMLSLSALLASSIFQIPTNTVQKTDNQDVFPDKIFVNEPMAKNLRMK